MKTLLNIGLSLGLMVQPAVAASQEAATIDSRIVRMVANSCAADEMFTVPANAPYTGGRMRQLPPSVAPLTSMEVTATPRSKSPVNVYFWASHPDDAAPLADRQAYSDQLLEALDAAITATGLFPEKTWNDQEETWVYSDPASPVAMEMSQLGVSVIIGCVRPDRRQLALDELMGRTRVERPVRPALAAISPPALADCSDPARARAVYDDFNKGGASDVLNTAQAGSEYFEHLTQWYGQELIDKGVWTEARRDAFRADFLEDRVIMGALEQQMESLQSVMGLSMELMEADPDGNPAGACRTVVQLMTVIADMNRVNEVQWNHAVGLYRAEARRLGVSLDDQAI